MCDGVLVTSKISLLRISSNMDMRIGYVGISRIAFSPTAARRAAMTVSAPPWACVGACVGDSVILSVLRLSASKLQSFSP